MISVSVEILYDICSDYSYFFIFFQCVVYDDQYGAITDCVKQ